MTIEQYNKDPVFYCRNCLSLRIRDVEHLDNSEYCDKCGSTDIGSVDIQTWREIYKARYGRNFLE